MGKGKNAFYKFIDESYFAFWFRQWAAFFIVVGVIMVIAGIVVYSVYPASQASNFAKNQIVTSANDPTYPAWVTQNEFVSYSFMSITSNKTCQKVGPFVYSVASVKTQVTFSGDSVTYVQTKAKTFDSGQSANPTTVINGLNPTYIALIKNQTSEEELYFKIFKDSTIVSDLETFYTTTVPKLLGARAIGQTFQTTYSRSIQFRILVDFLSTGLNNAINNYPLRYLAAKAPLVPIPFVGNDATVKGIYNILYQAFLNCSTIGKDVPTFSSEFATGFQNVGTGACGTYLKGHALTPSLWTTNGHANLFFSNLSAPNLNLWFDPVSPSTKGLCSGVSPRSAPTAIFSWMSGPQLDDICDNFFSKFFDEFLPAGASKTDLGSRRFCVGPLESSFWPGSTNPNLVLPSVPQYVTVPDFTLRSQSTYNGPSCQKYVNALADTTDFAAPVYQNLLTSYPGLNGAEIATLKTYISSFETTYQRWFTSLWLTSSTQSSLGCSQAAGCYFAPLGSTTADGSKFTSSDFDALRNLLFPQPNIIQATYAISNSDPKPTVQTSMFTPITDATGILSLALGLNNQTFLGGAFGSSFTSDQFNELKKYANDAITAWYSSTSASPPTAANVGYLQFAQAKLACGPNNQARTCSVAREFFGIRRSYDAELALAANSSQLYYNSFTPSDANPSFTILTATQVFNALKNNPEALLTQSPGNTNSKYLYFLLSTFIRDSAVSGSALSSRIAIDWANGFSDAATTKYAPGLKNTFAYDPDGSLYSVQISTTLDQAFTYQKVDGVSQVSVYPAAESLSGLFNSDGFPPGKVSQGSSVKVFDLSLLRSFTFVFGSSTADLNGITSSIGVVGQSDWAVNANYGILKNNVMPSLLSPYVTVSPCNVALNNICDFPIEDAGAPQDLFSTSQIIYSDLPTGLISKYQSCVVYSVSTGPSTFPFSAPTLSANAVYSQLQKKTSRILSSETSASYVGQFTGVKNTSLAVLLALLIVGGLFIFVGVVLIVFWVIRRNRKMKAQSQMELVQDPFNEKKSNTGNLKY